MKLLALRLCEHDSNISYYDGEKLHYFKSERHLQIKHHGYSNLWEWRKVIKELWDVDASEIDEIAIVFDPWLHKLPTDNDKFFPAIEYEYFPAPCKVWRVNHHYAHYLSCWPLCDKADVGFVFDGNGDLNTSWTVFKDNKLVESGLYDTNGSLGIELGNAGSWLGIKVNEQYNFNHANDLCGKTMGLQSYGNIDENFLQQLKQFDVYQAKELFDISNWNKHCGSELIARLTPLDWIRTVHYYVEFLLVNFFKKYATANDTIFYSGGVAQNVIWNTALREAFPKIVIPPHCADDGLSIGAIEWLRIKNNIPPFKFDKFPFIQLDTTPLTKPSTTTIRKVAEYLAEGKVVAWYQGNGEIGPRALGHRSILLDPRLPDGKNKINSVKNRESFRPFGASILAQHKSKYFYDDNEDRFMLFVSRVKNILFPAITHVDGTCRIQTVDETNGDFYDLLTCFYQLTGCPAILNTSLNLAGKPIAGSPSDAHLFFEQTKTDVLVVGDEIFVKLAI